MKGIVFNVLQRVVTEKYGEDTWDDLLEAASLEGTYTAVGSYDDTELLALVGAACTALGTTADDLLRWFGRSAMPVFAERYPQFFEGHTSARPMVLTLNDIIHPEVRKLYPGADVPVFAFGEKDGAITIGYDSPRRLCAFAEGLLHGAADHFGEHATISQDTCMLRGDAACTIVVSFEQA